MSVWAGSVSTGPVSLTHTRVRDWASQRHMTWPYLKDVAEARPKFLSHIIETKAGTCFLCQSLLASCCTTCQLRCHGPLSSARVTYGSPAPTRIIVLLVNYADTINIRSILPQSGASIEHIMNCILASPAPIPCCSPMLQSTPQLQHPAHITSVGRSAASPLDLKGSVRWSMPIITQVLQGPGWGFWVG